MINYMVNCMDNNMVSHRIEHIISNMITIFFVNKLSTCQTHEHILKLLMFDFETISTKFRAEFENDDESSWN